MWDMLVSGGPVPRAPPPAGSGEGAGCSLCPTLLSPTRCPLALPSTPATWVPQAWLCVMNLSGLRVLIYKMANTSNNHQESTWLSSRGRSDVPPPWLIALPGQHSAHCVASS